MRYVQIGSSDKKATKKAGQMRARQTMVTTEDPPSSRAADPANFGGVISTGWC